MQGDLLILLMAKSTDSVIIQYHLKTHELRPLISQKGPIEITLNDGYDLFSFDNGTKIGFREFNNHFWSYDFCSRKAQYLFDEYSECCQTYQAVVSNTADIFYGVSIRYIDRINITSGEVIRIVGSLDSPGTTDGSAAVATFYMNEQAVISENGEFILDIEETTIQFERLAWARTAHPWKPQRSACPRPAARARLVARGHQ